MTEPREADAPLGDAEDDGEVTVSPAAALAAIKASQEAVRQQTHPSATAMFTVWGVAFLISYSSLYLGYSESAQMPRGWSMAVLGACVVGAMVFTAIHIARRTSGIRGTSSRVGAMYGWSWCICFVFAMVIFGAVADAGAPPLAMSILTNAVALLIVAALYMAGGALFGEWRMFALGAWFAVVGSIAAIVAPPEGYLVQAIAGGGGFLVAAVAAQLIERWRSR
ncbi:hypothetical protein [Pseudactinotalea suaedae]|uniref:hypothetical protein n=1 Tax=Pseudactinotalea suaedae TaxID=1524924 RepID=UPI0012E1D6A4|nr:hypothetical protein [Pseudactinotalea suaedae]